MSSPTLPSPNKVSAASCLSGRSFKTEKCVFLAYCLGIFQFVAFALALRALGFALDFRAKGEKQDLHVFHFYESSGFNHLWFSTTKVLGSKVLSFWCQLPMVGCLMWSSVLSPLKGEFYILDSLPIVWPPCLEWGPGQGHVSASSTLLNASLCILL